MKKTYRLISIGFNFEEDTAYNSWRLFAVDENVITLEVLHQAIQIAFGLNDEHLHRFYGRNDVEYTRKDQMEFVPDVDYAPLDSEVTTIKDAAKNMGKTFFYDYDFGDSWHFTVRYVENEKELKETSPLILRDGSGSGPIENFGGLDSLYEAFNALPKNYEDVKNEKTFKLNPTTEEQERDATIEKINSLNPWYRGPHYVNYTVINMLIQHYIFNETDILHNKPIPEEFSNGLFFRLLTSNISAGAVSCYMAKVYDVYDETVDGDVLEKDFETIMTPVRKLLDSIMENNNSLKLTATKRLPPAIVTSMVKNTYLEKTLLRQKETYTEQTAQFCVENIRETLISSGILLVRKGYLSISKKHLPIVNMSSKSLAENILLVHLKKALALDDLYYLMTVSSILEKVESEDGWTDIVDANSHMSSLFIKTYEYRQFNEYVENSSRLISAELTIFGEICDWVREKNSPENNSAKRVLKQLYKYALEANF